MQKSFQTLYSFIESAVKSRKYPENSANGYRAALKLFEAELSEEELSSIQLFSDRLEQIYSSVFSKNQLKFSAGSLVTYKSRVMKVLSDYEKYGADPTKMASWNPQVIKRGPRKKTELGDSTTSSTGSDQPEIGQESSLAPARTLPSGIVVIFPKTMDAQATFGEFGKELKELDQKAQRLLGKSNDEGKGPDDEESGLQQA